MNLLQYAERAVDLANTFQPPGGPDRLTDLDELRALFPPGSSWIRRVTFADLDRLRAVRPKVRALFDTAAAGKTPRTVTLLNALLHDHPASPQIVDHMDQDWHMHLAEDGTTVADGYLAGALLGLAWAVATHGPDRLGVCQSPPCRLVFLDVSTNRSRRYCSERCATRFNVAAYRMRKRVEVR